MAVNATNSIGLQLRAFGVTQGSRVKVDGATLGFKAQPSYSRVEQVLSPATIALPANVLTQTVKSFFYIRCSGKVSITVTDTTALTTYTQIVDSIFIFSPASTVTVSVKTAEAFNVNALVIFA